MRFLSATYLSLVATIGQLVACAGEPSAGLAPHVPTSTQTIDLSDVEDAARGRDPIEVPGCAPCDGDGEACKNMAIRLTFSASAGEQRCVGTWFENACLLGSYVSCNIQAARLMKEPGGDLLARDLWKSACDAKTYEACLAYVGYVERESPRGAIGLYEKICDDGQPLGCYEAARLLDPNLRDNAQAHRREELAKDAVRARSLYDRACANNVGPACVLRDAL